MCDPINMYVPVSGVTRGGWMRVREKVSERNRENEKNIMEKNNPSSFS